MDLATFAFVYVCCLVGGAAAVCFNLTAVVAFFDRVKVEKNRRKLVKLYMRATGMPKAVAERQATRTLSTTR